MQVTLKCPCGEVFQTPQSQAVRGAKYCSKECFYQFNRKAGGATHHELYHTWENVKARVRKHHRYVNRGISLYQEWVNDSAHFIADIEKELGPRPKNHTLDRIDNDGDYAPGNLRWATSSEQQHNRGQRGTTKFEKGWIARITREYQSLYVGYFNTEEEAHDAYLSAKDAYQKGGMSALLTAISRYRKRRS